MKAKRHRFLRGESFKAALSVHAATDIGSICAIDLNLAETLDRTSVCAVFSFTEMSEFFLLVYVIKNQERIYKYLDLRSQMTITVFQRVQVNK